MKNPGRVKSIWIEKLFGLYDHRIVLKEERVTVLHGPNGVGKTTLLKLIYGILSGNFDVCGEVPFLGIEIGFEQGTLSLRREGAATPRWRKEDRPIVMRWKQEQHLFGPRSNQFYELRNDLLALRLDESGWHDGKGQSYTKAEVSRAREEYDNWLTAALNWDAPPWFSPQQVSIIHTDRLFLFGEPDTRQHRYVSVAVDTCASRMKANLEGHLAAYATESEQLERSLPFRLADSARKLLSLSEISQELQKLNSERKRLQDLDLLAEDPGAPFDPAGVAQMDAVAQAVMSLYVRDTRQKLQRLADIARRLEIFRDAINSKFLNKAVEISREHGLQVVSVDGQVLSLSELSSGEQHELLLLFNLLFETSPDTLVLIDEPELSMHPSWKRTFLQDVLEVAAVARIDIVLATHSVQIVNGRDDLMVGLSGERT